MVPYKTGILTAFANASGDPNLFRIHFSPDGNNLGGGDVRASVLIGCEPCLTN